MLNWRQSTKNTKVELYSEVKFVEDHSGSYAVFTEQGSSASQMTAAKVMDIISRLPGCAGQAADAVSAYTQVKMKDAPQLLKNPKSECPDIWIRLPRHKWPKSWSSMEDPVVPLEAKSVWSSFGRIVMGKAIWENPIEARLGEGFQLGMLIRTPWKRVFLICVWRKNILIRCGKYSIKKLIWENQHLSLIMKILGCTQRQCEISKEIVDNYRTLFESRISAGATEKFPYSEKFSYFFVVLRHGGSCQEMCGAIWWVGKQDDSTTLQSIYSMLWWPSRQRRRKWNLLEICHKYAPKLFWNAYTWHELEDLIFDGKYWLNRVTCYTSNRNNSSRHDFPEFTCFVTVGSFTADVGLL